MVEYDSIKFLAFRYTICFLVMSLLLALGFKKVKYKNKPFYMLLICGTLNPLISQTLETTLSTFAPTSQIGVFYCLIPALVVVLSIPINREMPTKRQVFFMLVIISGILSINFVSGQMKGGTTLGLVLIVAEMFAVSVQRIFVRRASKHFTAFETIYFTAGMGALGYSITTILSHAARGRLNVFFVGLLTPDFVIPILYMGIMSAVVAFLLLTYAAGHLPIAVSSSTSMINSVITVLVGIFVLKEVFRPIDIIGTVITFLGLIGMSLSYNASVSNRFRQ